jgi:carbonic anhydrase/acetyltransferase-like protein (isoleucine patch superfamily)
MFHLHIPERQPNMASGTETQMGLPSPLVLSVNGISPRIADDVFLAPRCVVVGDVVIGPGSSVWFGAVIRGDVAPIRIGSRSNVQDCAVIHVDNGTACVVGDDVTIGHSAIVHASQIGDRVTIGMGSIVLSRCSVGDGAVIAAGAVVAEDTVVQPGALMMGIPAKEKLILEPERQDHMARNAGNYVRNAAAFRTTLTASEERRELNVDWRAHGG